MVLFTMVFLPNLAWADYTCGGQSLTFYYTGDSGPNYYYSGSGDNQVTEWNVTADAFYQSNSSLYSGFSYVKLTNVNPLSGPLTDFTLAGSINNNNPQANNNVNLKVYRLATLSATERTLIGSITIGGSDVPSYTYIAEDGVSQSFNNEYIQLAIERSSSETTPTFTTGQITNITLTFSGTDYGISVGNYRVTSNNATDIFGDGNASFTAASGDTPATLTLNDVTIGTSTVNSSIISNLEDEQLTINLVGTNKLFGFINDVSNSGTLAFTGTGSLAITCQNGDAVVRNFNNVTLDDGLYIQTNTPGTHWENYDCFRGEADLVSEMTITPSVYYPIWVLSLDAVSYVQVSEANKSNVLGDVNATVKYNSTDEQLILNGFACTTTGGATAIVLGDQEEFKIYLSGDNTISSGGTGNGVCFNREVAFLTVSTDANNPGKLTLVQPTSGNYGLANVSYDCMIYEDGLGFYNNTVSTVWPRLVIGGTQIMGTTDNVTGYENVSFDAGTNTLMLSGATIENATNEPDIDVYVKDLIVAISEANTVNGRFYGHYTLNGSKVGTIHFTKVEGGNTPPSITISGDTDDSGPVYEFSQCTWDNDLYLTEAKTAGDANVPGVYYGSGRFTNGNTTPKTVKISTVPSGVMLWIGETAVTSANADNVFSGDNVLDGKVSVTFGDENKLILDASETPITEALSEMPIVSALPNLTISFKGSSSLNRIVSTNSAATLTFELAEGADESETENSCSLSSSGEMPWQGFSGNPVFNDKLVYLPNDDSRIIQKLMPPSFSMEGDELHFSGLSDSWGTNSFDCYYSIDYVEGDDVETTEYDSENPETIETACKVTAHVEFTDVLGNTTVSDNVVGKYFGSAENPMRLVYGADPVDFVLAPAIEDGDGIKMNGIEANVTYNATTGKVSSSTLGSHGAVVSLSYVDATNKTTILLKNYFDMEFDVVPPAPSIELTEGAYPSTQDNITITSDGLANTTIKYQWDDEEEEDYPATGGVPFQAGTLKAWVEYTDDETSLSSEIVSATYTILPDPSLVFVVGDDPVEEDIDYVMGGTGAELTLPTLQNPHNVSVRYESGNTAIATVSADGTVTPVGIGTTTITATSEQTTEYAAGEASYWLNVYKSLSHSSITVEISAVTYNGQAQTPTVIVKDGDNVLPYGEDDGYDNLLYAYKVEFANNTNAALATAETNAPTATITALTDGSVSHMEVNWYRGSTTKTFTINKAQLTVTPDDKTYNVGDDITLTVSYDGFVNGETETVLTTQPTASCDADVTKPGSYTITVNGGEAQNYDFIYETGTLTINRQLNVSFSASNTWATYCGTENLAMPEGLKAYQVTAVEGATVTISEIGYIPANTAVLLQNVSNNNVWTDIAASAYTGATSTFENNKLIGTASAVDVSTITGGTVYILVNNMFRRSTSGTIPANRGYLVVATSSNAPQLSISIGDENTTAISNTDFTDNTDKAGEWYSIDGVKLNGQPQKPGLYIKNGKKVFINKK